MSKLTRIWLVGCVVACITSAFASPSDGDGVAVPMTMRGDFLPPKMTPPSLLELDAVMPRNSTLQAFVEEAFARVGRGKEEAKQWVEVLEKNWYSTPEDLLKISPDGWMRMGFPDMLVETLTVMLEETFSCTLECQHEGTPNEECTGCDCTGPWTGSLCETYDESIPKSKVEEQLKSFITLTKAEWDNIQTLTPLPGRVGIGIDLTSGEEKLPVVSLTYSDDTRVWRNAQGKVFRLPVEAVFKPSYSGFTIPKTSTFLFRTLYDYASRLFSWTVGMDIPGGVFSKHVNLQEVHEEYFIRDSLTVSQRAYTLYNLQLPSDPLQKTRAYQLHRFAKKAAACLPPDYETNPESRAIYRLFVENYGTSYTTSSLNGGMVEQLSHYSKGLNIADPNRSAHANSYSSEELESNAEIDLHHVMGESKTSKLDPTYEGNRKLTHRCFGGNPEKCHLDGGGDVAEWLASVEDNPVPLVSDLADISELIPDPLIRSYLQQEINSYITEKTGELKDVQTCPTMCSPYGQCSWPDEVCTCKFGGINGWLCDEITDGPHITLTPTGGIGFSWWNQLGGDLNGDGKTDLFQVTMNSQGKGQVQLSNGDGTFTVGPSVAITPGSSIGEWHVPAGDVNGDGKADIVRVTSNAQGQAVTMLSNGDGTFKEVGGVDVTPGNGISQWNVFGGDFNGDGKTDILRVISNEQGKGETRLSNGDGTFRYGGPVTVTRSNQIRQWNIPHGDFNGDGRADLLRMLIDSRGDARVSFAKTDGSGTLYSYPR